MSKPSRRAFEIERAFQDAWAEFGDDKSTEFLIGITADRMGTDYENVAYSLCRVAEYEQKRERFHE